MKKIFVAVVAVCLLSMASAPVLSLAAEKGSVSPEAPNPAAISGPVISAGDNRIHINNTSSASFSGEIVLNISDTTKILDAVTGYPVPLSGIKEGETIYSYIGPAMTMSLPPVTNTELVLCHVPADDQVPSYETIMTSSLQKDGNSALITTYSGKELLVSAGDCILVPYLTKNIVTIHDLVPETPILVWTEDNTLKRASKITIFSSPLQPGWTQEDNSWYYVREDGTRHTGWLSDSGSWYYLDPNTGIMRTGFLIVDGKTYYLEGDGRMLATSKTFTPDSSGVLR